MSIPEHFHFIFGLKPQTEPFHLAWYLCLRSCRVVHPDARITFHYLNLPHGPWWDRIQGEIELAHLSHDGAVFDTRRYAEHQEGRFIQGTGLGYAHQADYLRLQILAEQGGIYADIDTLFVRPCPTGWREQECVMGQEIIDADPPTLCNALIMAAPGAEFIQTWLHRMGTVFDGTWNRHSCIEPALLSREMPNGVTVVPPTPFFHFRHDTEGLLSLFARDETVPDDLCSIHMWSHLWWDAGRTDFLHFHSGFLTEDFIRRYDTTYNRLARRYLD